MKAVYYLFHSAILVSLVAFVVAGMSVLTGKPVRVLAVEAVLFGLMVGAGVLAVLIGIRMIEGETWTSKHGKR